MRALALLLILLVLPVSALAAETSLRVTVEQVLSERTELLPGGTREQLLQELSVVVAEGPRAGERFTIENDYFASAPGDSFFVTETADEDGLILRAVGEPDRRGVLLALVALFVLAVALVGRWQGVRALAALVVSFGLILFVMVPAIAAGVSPILAGTGTAVLILALAMALTHGLSRPTLAAFSGTALAVIATAVLAYVGTALGKISGIAGDSAAFLSLMTDGRLDLSGIFLAGVVIGALGLLDDVAITQVATVAEFRAHGASRREAFTRAMTVGRAHAGALINTLALAYAGAALPLLLVFSFSTEPALSMLNRELFAGEIIRTVAGSVGLVLAVPLSTFFAALLVRPGDAHKHGHTH